MPLGVLTSAGRADSPRRTGTAPCLSCGQEGRGVGSASPEAGAEPAAPPLRGGWRAQCSLVRQWPPLFLEPWPRLRLRGLLCSLSCQNQLG